MLIYLVRHGETDYNKTKKLQGWSDIPLNEYGIELAVKTAEGLKDIEFDKVFSSPFKRSYATAEKIVENRNMEIETDDRLKEIKLGPNEGDSYIEARKNTDHPLHNFFRKPEDYSPIEGAESIADVKKRANEFLIEKVFPLERKYRSILIVAHGALNRCILNPILGITDKNFWKISLPNCAVSVLSLEKGKLKVLERSKTYY